MIQMPHLKMLVDDLMSMAKGITIKRNDLANQYDTLEIIRDADYYVMATSGEDTFMSYTKYPKPILRQAGLTDNEIITGYYSKVNIPENKREIVLNLMRQSIIDNYEEKNDYYREMYGLPPYNTTKFVYLDAIPITGVDVSKPIHLMTIDEIMILNSLGKIDELIAKYPDKGYLKYLGAKRISPSKARVADEFEILQLGPCKNTKNKEMFLRNYEWAKRYILFTQYRPESYGDEKHYTAYIGFMILTQAMHQCISSNEEILNNKDYYDEETVKYVLQSFGMNIFDDIPLKFRKSISDQIERLISNKGTDKVYEIINDIFGLKSMDVYKYFITKTIKRDSYNNPIFSANPEDMYDLKISQVNIKSDNVALDLRKTENILDYDRITEADNYWGIYETKADIKKDLLNHDFNYMETKYIAINTAYDVTKMNFEINYLMNTLLALKKYESGITIKTADSSAMIPLFDTIVYLFALLSKEVGYNGDIPSSMAAVASVYRFNFEYNIDDMKAIVAEYGEPNYINLDNLHIKMPKDSIQNTNELLSYYFDNVQIYKTLEKAMVSAKTYKQYQMVKRLLDYLTTSKQTTDIYKKTDGTVATTYYDYLLDVQPQLAFSVNNLPKEFIADKVDEVLAEIEAYVYSDQLKYMFTKIPTINEALMKRYIAKLITVFKSYTIDLNAINIIYEIDDETHNKFKFFDQTITNENRYDKNITHSYSGIGINESITRTDAMHMDDEIIIRIIRKDGIEYEF